MSESMLAHMREIDAAEIAGTVRESEAYRPTEKVGVPSWLLA